MTIMEGTMFTWEESLETVKLRRRPLDDDGNEFEDGNPLEFPASLPHVVTVAATTAFTAPVSMPAQGAVSWIVGLLLAHPVVANERAAPLCHTAVSQS